MKTRAFYQGNPNLILKIQFFKAKRYEAPSKDKDANWSLHGKKLLGFSSKSPEMVPNDSWVHLRNSQLCAGTMDKSSLGSGSKKQVFYIMTRDYGEESAARAMWRMCRTGFYIQQKRLTDFE